MDQVMAKFQLHVAKVNDEAPTFDKLLEEITPAGDQDAAFTAVNNYGQVRCILRECLNAFEEPCPLLVTQASSAYIARTQDLAHKVAVLTRTVASSEMDSQQCQEGEVAQLKQQLQSAQEQCVTKYQSITVLRERISIPLQEDKYILNSALPWGSSYHDHQSLLGPRPRTISPIDAGNFSTFDTYYISLRNFPLLRVNYCWEHAFHAPPFLCKTPSRLIRWWPESEQRKKGAGAVATAVRHDEDQEIVGARITFLEANVKVINEAIEQYDKPVMAVILIVNSLHEKRYFSIILALASRPKMSIAVPIMPSGPS
ncbi:hypothetical protein CORC01_09242 [Colletotrichum orchidophilum]|uniref:Uncharacterized protein n=1 Tax=Colletotrichum orchidophilum TaxID=1209926 RepID=A0A1G4B250_9PEZI|nr:uncharacterized protein CORC01_09242 [Colletotrichum orchidophilum]OHE95509.1 hypothetical protein CORC01_09242 [Colletotrichum orchidophilum]